MLSYARIAAAETDRGVSVGGQEEKGFVIRDRRSQSGEKPSSSVREAPPASPPRRAEAAPPHDPAGTQDVHPPVTFSSFVFSLGTSALMLMGEQLDPQEGSSAVNLPQAKEIIDILSILEGKTQGNLNPEEQTMLKDMLYALRMKYVSLASPPGGAGARQGTTSS